MPDPPLGGLLEVSPCPSAKVTDATAVTVGALKIRPREACAVAVGASTPTITLNTCHDILHPLGLGVMSLL